MPAAVVEHWPRAERILDAFWCCLLVFSAPVMALGTLFGPHTASPTTDASIPWYQPLAVWPFALGLAYWMARRISRYQVSVENGVVTVSRYQFLGYRQVGESQTFQVSDLGQLVLDTERKCLGMCNFTGIYVTKGFPTFERPMEVAFEIPIFYTGWNHVTGADCFLGCYINTFRSLTNVLGFQYHGRESHRQKTTVTGGEGHQAMLAQFNADYEDSLASYENYLSLNFQAMPPGNFRFERHSAQSRSVYNMICTNGANPLNQ